MDDEHKQPRLGSNRMDADIEQMVDSVNIMILLIIAVYSLAGAAIAVIGYLAVIGAYRYAQKNGHSDER